MQRARDVAPIRSLVALAALTIVCTASPRAIAKGESTATREPQPTRELFWLDAEGGVEALYLRTVVADADPLTVGILPNNAVGSVIGVGAGLRIVFITLGVRGRVGLFDQNPGDPVDHWQLWTLDAEAGIRVPLGRFEPKFSLSAGYASFGGLSHAIDGLQQGIDVRGVDTRMGGGFDWYVTRHITLGALLTGEALFLTRDSVSVRDLATAQQVGTLNEAKARLLQGNGSSVGSAVALTGGLSVRF